MTNSLIPYTFVPGTKARASEVNANFEAVADAINSLNSSISSLADDMTTALNTRLELDLSNSHSITNCVIAAPNGVATYSGSNITVKSGVKVLIPNGRNSDGTLKNITYTLTSDITYTETSTSENSDLVLYYNKATNTLASAIDFYSQAEMPQTSPDLCIWLKTDENIFYNLPSGASSWTSQTPNSVVLARFSRSGGNITELKPCNIISFSAMANSDLSNLTSQSSFNVLKPSNNSMILSVSGEIADIGGRKYYKSYSDRCLCALVQTTDGYIAPLFVGVTERSATGYNDNDSTPSITNSFEWNGKLFYYYWAGSKMASNSSVTKAYSYPYLCNKFAGTEGINAAKAVLELYYNSINNAMPVKSYLNGASWYRVWGDGWIEQGGRTGHDSVTITYPIAFSNTNYTLNLSGLSGDQYNENCFVSSISTTGFTGYVESNNSGFWYACGY